MCIFALQAQWTNDTASGDILTVTDVETNDTYIQ